MRKTQKTQSSYAIRLLPTDLMPCFLICSFGDLLLKHNYFSILQGYFSEYKKTYTEQSFKAHQDKIIYYLSEGILDMVRGRKPIATVLHADDIVLILVLYEAALGMGAHTFNNSFELTEDVLDAMDHFLQECGEILHHNFMEDTFNGHSK